MMFLLYSESQSPSVTNISARLQVFWNGGKKVSIKILGHCMYSKGTRDAGGDCLFVFRKILGLDLLLHGSASSL